MWVSGWKVGMEFCWCFVGVLPRKLQLGGFLAKFKVDVNEYIGFRYLFTYDSCVTQMRVYKRVFALYTYRKD